MFIILQHYDYERLVKALFHAVSLDFYAQDRDEPSFVLQAGITLLNTVACNVDGSQKLTLGNMGVIEKMLELIRFRLNTRKKHQTVLCCFLTIFLGSTSLVFLLLTCFWGTDCYHRFELGFENTQGVMDKVYCV